MDFWPQFLMVTIVGLLAVISPGPDFVVVTRNTLLYSKKVGLLTAVGIVVGNAWWISLSILGVSVLIAKFVLLYRIIKILGAGYLIYIGIKSLRTKRKDGQDGEPVAKTKSELSDRGAFWNGLLTNLLNPKAALFFASFFSVVITTETPLLLRSFYGFEIATIAFVWFSTLATILSIGRVKAAFGKIHVWVEKLTGAILVLLGAKLALSETN